MGVLRKRGSSVIVATVMILFLSAIWMERSAAQDAVIPSYNEAELPEPGVPGRLAYVMDGARGLWSDQGSQWVPVNGKVFNVKDFGAKSDGSDQTSQIQAAFNAVVAAGGGTVWFPAGIYGYSGQSQTESPGYPPNYRAALSVNGGATQIRSVVIAGDRNATLRYLGRDTSQPYYVDCLYIDNILGVTVRDLSFEGTGSAANNCNFMVIHFAAGTRLNVASGLYFANHWGGVPIDHSGTGEAVISHNFIDSSNNAGILQTSSAGSALIFGNYVRVSQTPQSCNNSGSIEIAGGNSTIIGNYVMTPAGDGNPLSCPIDRAIQIAKSNNTVIGNVIVGPGPGSYSAGITLDRGTQPNSNSTITGNTFLNLGVGIQTNQTTYGLGAAPNGLYISGNSFSNVTTTADTKRWSNHAIEHIVSGDLALILQQGKGLVLRASDGANCYRVTVNNAGVLSTTTVTCP